ncbi:16S rRNA (cytidine(1402)-2'-O)-methyltransferase [Loigolactobacillus bifermentans]|uniref:Ribosomal RNA small subunit methyltransferase I n=1 Tax=Loigolactobacillus bifermentans DSM 20003 TaxID=1423726 RepID=A0A0R1H0P4_9LACO|nr:16S rRNA (cytidine(1402)-2'-O)-methyltransferase [Loigolactobacillus bifermentans]KRK40053.1 uroporphyrin-III C tetrapyrrole methyltransferase [Loigolactobacillus bifermentans DSM 20003]QGG61659.1 16S rRNA (cytidine(1402)-2'-O)-methyltransferase [Loigolactobacillus bifermentans]
MQSQKSFAAHDTGTLYLVPTPIGNLEDMTMRSVHILQQVTLIAAEDTRNTQKLLNHFDIQTKQISFHEHNTQERIPQLLAYLQKGDDLAQLSDAGMPSISDPGQELVAAAIKADIPVVPLPGASAGVTALIASGLVPQPFYFYGFLNRKKSQQVEELTALNQHQETMIFYEAPHRLVKTLQAMADVFGADRQVVLARELTKKFEEFLRGSLAEVLTYFKEQAPRGEFVVLVAGNAHPVVAADPYAALNNHDYVAALVETGQPAKAAIKQVAKQRGVPKQQVYQDYHGF